MKWDTFDQFKEKTFCLRFVTSPKEKSQWENWNWACPAFSKKWLCKHVVGLGIQSKSCKTPIVPNSGAGRNLASGVQSDNFGLKA